jgi:hypothetical protein
MNVKRCSGLPGIEVALALGLLVLLPSKAYPVRPTDTAATIEVRDKPVEIHNKDQGWGELPSLAVTADYAYVAYDVREGYESHVYLARVPRRPGGEITKIRSPT